MRMIIDCLKAPFICKARATKLIKLDQNKKNTVAVTLAFSDG